MKGAILVNAYTQSQAELNQPLRLKEELLALGAEVEILRNSPESVQRILSCCAFCVYLDKDKYSARMLDGRVRLFNRAQPIETCDDKMLTHLALSGFPAPETVAGLLCYTEGAEISRELAESVENRLGYPVVVKECYGSLGKGVYLANDRAELIALMKKLQHKPHLFQRFIRESAGRDVRIITVGGKTVCAMLRTSCGDFRSNAALGGHGEVFDPGEEGRRLAEAVSKRLGLDYCGIDLLLSHDGYLVCEVNSNAFFGTIEQVTGVNVARRYAEHILCSVREEA